MYKAFYSLAAAPFSKELKVSDAYVSTPHQEALGCLNCMKQVRGMGLFVGEPGAGKTYALRVFTESLNKSLYKVVYFPLSTGSVNDFYRGLAFGLGDEPKNRKVDLFRQIQQTITVLFHERKVTPVFILDEMQMAKDVFLSDLNLLFNFQMDSHNPFILLLCGLPYLRDRLALNHNRPLAQPHDPCRSQASHLYRCGFRSDCRLHPRLSPADQQTGDPRLAARLYEESRTD
ncbi:ExeA family protein [Desulfoscipio gibsoniae]|uniref:ORC1/DEAH AAA+ ATPase domain-containing protein n=1 Tax=Desulfoscipio gibsoniae DSM 7213 TaxID=767817 RepID=R4KVQ0_9FIRM|nr:ATP-binding protein [Desulfoscipio gibsoniae]AGL03701.1 hypothetical protein Desgi_4470 [Desulfoscipio gibsoniae DSM 7213]